jgi:hypothetical protein
MMRGMAIRGVGGLAAVMAGATMGVMLAGAAPPLPVTPKPPGEPYLIRLTITGVPSSGGAMESCVDPQAMLASARERVKARPAGAPSPLTGCTHSHEARPGGAMHTEMRCDRAAGARMSYRMTADGTPDDLRSHTETYGFDPATGAPKTTVRDSHMVRLGPCPSDLKPGQIRTADGKVIDASAQLARILERARGGSAPPQ